MSGASNGLGVAQLKNNYAGDETMRLVSDMASTCRRAWCHFSRAGQISEWAEIRRCIIRRERERARRDRGKVAPSHLPHFWTEPDLHSKSVLFGT